MHVRIYPADQTTTGVEPVSLVMPPDKSILHRLLFLGSLTTSAIHVPIASPNSISHDIIATVLALESLGVPVDIGEKEINMQGVGLRGYRAPTHSINCANSGTTARLLMGLLAGQSFSSIITGDSSLSKRPMKRLADLLAMMGADIAAGPNGTLPVSIEGKSLQGANITLPVASAQMKTALLLAGLFGESTISVREPAKTRDHTERMMAAFGFGIEPVGEITLHPEISPELPEEIVYHVPGDLSCASFMIAAAVLLKKRVVIQGVLLNPSRTRFLEVLTLMGLELEAENIIEDWNEPRGDLIIYGDRLPHALAAFQVDGRDVPLLIDELPVLMVLALFADGESSIRGAEELRLKEADRIALTARQFEAFGADIQELKDGIVIQGMPERVLKPASIQHGGDHRLAMAFSIAALACEASCEMTNGEAVAISYPEFFENLNAVAGKDCIQVLK